MVQFCQYCGDEIEFRYVNGVLIPLHATGGCSRSTQSSSQNRPFTTNESYVNPNAKCPVCGETVFYYQSSHGGRVFFDALGWPWPKHACTDNPKAQNDYVPLPDRRGRQPWLRDSTGNILQIFKLSEKPSPRSSEISCFNAILQNASTRRTLNVILRAPQSLDISVDDLVNAPAFIVHPRDGNISFFVDFICGRTKGIVRLVGTKINRR